MPRQRERLYIGIKGHVVAIDPITGTEIWRTKLKTSSFATVHLVGGRLYAAAGGELFALDQISGQIVWNNPLKGLGFGVIAFPGASDTVVMEMVEQQRRAAAAAAAT